MSRLNKLIEELCPEGVEWKKLGDIGSFYGGLTGKSKKDFGNGNAKFITYMNVYSNPALNPETTDTVQISEGEKQNKVQYGDILFTGSSETPDECGMSSVVTIELNEDYYLNSFCFGYRLHKQDEFLPDYLKHYFRSQEVRREIARTASGVTRYNVSKAKFAKIEIPVPPLPVQEEIVRILDKFTTLEAELEAELDCRKRQYEFYRDQLLSFEGERSEGVKWMKLGDITEILRGRRLTKKELSNTASYPVFHGGIAPIGFYSQFNRPANTVMIINVGASAGTVGFCNQDFWSSDGCFCIGKSEKINDKFLYYLLAKNQHSFVTRVRHAGIPTLDSKVIADYTIPVPSLSEQRRIVSILDRFEALTTDLQSGLPAEIKARRKQYEYYREKLLTFKRCQN